MMVSIGLILFGLVMVYSASFITAQEKLGDGYYFFKKQLLFSGIGFLFMFFFSFFPVDWIRKNIFSLLAVVFISLVLVLIPGVGQRVGGAQRWISLGFFQFQPAEIAKYVILFFVARQLDSKKNEFHRFMPAVIAPVLLVLPLFVLLLLQPDFGSTVLVCAVILFLMFLAKVPLKYLSPLLVLSAVVIGLLAITSPYRMRRFMSFLDPWQDPEGKGFQVIQSMIGFHQGGMSGAGLGNSKEKLFYLPEAHNDFIFAVVGEEFGWIGVVLVSLSFLFFCYRGLRITVLAQRNTRDLFLPLFAGGITLLLTLQAFVNMGVVLGLLPTKGLALPFISYGGTALIMNCSAVGLLLSAGREAT